MTDTPPPPSPGPHACVRCARGMTFQPDRVCTACRRKLEHERPALDEVER